MLLESPPIGGLFCWVHGSTQYLSMDGQEKQGVSSLVSRLGGICPAEVPHRMRGGAIRCFSVMFGLGKKRGPQDCSRALIVVKVNINLQRGTAATAALGGRRVVQQLRVI